MSFIWPAMLVLLLLVPLVAFWYIRMQQRRRQVVTNFGSLGTMQGAANRSFGWRRHVAPALFLASLTILIFALARPKTMVSLPRIQGTVILAFDVSGSMAADDLKPTRMDAAKAAVQNFIERQSPTVRIGVVAFSDSGLSIQVPTNKKDDVLAAIGRLTSQRGTSLANGILAALTTIETANGVPTNYYSNQTPTPAPTPIPVPRGTYGSSVIVLLTDGENNQNPDPLEAAQTAADRGVRIYTVGIGSAAGTNLHVDGFTIHTQLDEAMLQQISQMTGGTYYNAQNEEDLLAIYDNLSPELIVKPEEMEITALLAGVSIIFLLLGGTASLLWFGRVP